MTLMSNKIYLVKFPYPSARLEALWKTQPKQEIHGIYEERLSFQVLKDTYSKQSQCQSVIKFYKVHSGTQLLLCII